MVTKKIMLVDDDPEIIEALRETIISHYKGSDKLEFRSAYDGEEAFRLLKKEPVDIVIIDLRMPRMNGLETIEKSRLESEVNRDVPFILLSGYLDDLKDSKDIMEGIYLLDKPLNGGKLMEVVEKWLADSDQ